MQNKKSAKLRLAEKTLNRQESLSERVMRQPKRNDSKLLLEEDNKDEPSNDGVEGRTRTDDLLLLCRPLSVYLTRLPESLVKKNAESAKKPAKKKKPVFYWKNGFYGKKRSKNRKTEKETCKVRQSLDSRPGDDENPSREPATSEESRINFDLTERSPRRSVSGVEEPTGAEHEGAALRASLDKESSTSPAREVKLSEAQECKISDSVSINTAPSRIDAFPMSAESEMSKRESNGGERNSGLVIEKDRMTLSAVENRIENNSVLQRLEKETSRSPAKPARKRKNSSISERNSGQERLQDCKKMRSALSLSESSSLEKKIPPIHEVLVVVNRLDDSRSPLVEKWKNRVDISQLDEVAPNVRETVLNTTSSVNPVEKENGKEFEAVGIAGDASERIPALGESGAFDIHKNMDIVMCSSTEDGSDEDDDEIIEFLAARRRKKSCTRKILRDEKSDEELAENEKSRRNVKTPSAIRSKSRAKQPKDRRRKRLQSCSTTDDGKSEISSVSAKSEGIQSKTPSWRSPRKSRRPSYSQSDASSCEEAISPPVTRSKSRAAIDPSIHDDSLNSTETFHPRRKRSFFYRISDSGSSDEADEPNQKIIEDEDQVVINEAVGNVNDVLERERIEENVNSLDSAVANDPKEQSADLNRESEEKMNQKTSRPDDAYKMTEKMKANWIRRVLEGTKKTHEVAETKEVEKDDESLDSTAIIDSNLTSNPALPFERDDDMENSLARKRLAAMKDAMVVLMRLEDLENECPAGNFEFRATGNSDFPSDLVEETHKPEDRSVSRPSVDASQPENRSVNQFLIPEGSLDPKLLQSVSTGQNQREKSASPRKKQTERHDKVPEPSTEAISGVTLSRTESGYHEINESDDEGQLTVDESVPPEMAETDVAAPLIVIDELDGKTREPVASPPSAKTPLNNSAGPGNRANCEEQGGNDENVSSTHRCITCDKFFKDATELEEHRISSGICSSGLRCPGCSCMFNTPTELMNHRCKSAKESVERRNSVEPKERVKIRTVDPENSVVTTSEARPKGKKEKAATAKNPPRKKGPRTRCRSDNLTCNVCSTNFDTKTDLSEHLYKHSPEELQEAFRAAKAKAMADSRAEQAAQQQEAQVSSEKTVNDQGISDAIIAPPNDNSLARDLGTLERQIIAPDINAIASNTFNKDSLTSRPATVCLCHRDIDLASLDKTDLQIEMVLLCKYCHVIFRRRECLEVHYRTSTICSINRTSTICSINRTRERCPSLFCANCQSTLNSWADMRQHLELHADQNSERTIRFVCNICRVVFVGFGALFYNHWTSHSKDSMFVAGRYNFPKFSVQTINGTEKLPFGARSDENYIFVAEHVCATCKKPFSTRRDLEQHQQSALCSKSNVGGAARHIPQPVRLPMNVNNNASTKQNRRSPAKTLNSVENHDLMQPKMYCDICKLAFINEYWLSMHSKNMHHNHFSYVPMTLSGTPLALPFQCTKCSAFAVSASAIEKHWRTDLLHKSGVGSSKAKKAPCLPKTVAVTSSVEQNTNVQDPLLLSTSIINVNDVTSTQKSKVSEVPPVIAIDDADSNSESPASEVIPLNQSDLTRNEESIVSVPSITSTESIQVPNMNEGPEVETPLTDSLSLASDSIGNFRTKTRALEDPCVDVMLSKTSGSNLSASLVINDSVHASTDSTGQITNTESYRILLPNGAAPGNMTMLLSRTSATNPAKEPQTVSLTRSPVTGNDKVNEPDGPDEAARFVGMTGSSVAHKDGVQKMIISDSVMPLGDPTPASLARSTIPGNIKIVQRKDSDVAPSLTGSSAAPNNGVAPTKGIVSRENIEPSSIATPKQVTENRCGKTSDIFIVPEIIELNDDAEECENEKLAGAVNPAAQSLEGAKCKRDLLQTQHSTMTVAAAKSLPAEKTQKISDSGSGSETGSNSAVSKSVLPARLKMIRTALKASEVSFEEERWDWLRSSSANRDVVNSTGPKKQGFLRVKDLSELQAARNYTCVVCNSSFESEKLLNEHRRQPMCGGSIRARNHQYPRGIAAALVLPDPSERANTPEPKQPPQLDPLSHHSASRLQCALVSQPPLCPPSGTLAAAPATAAIATAQTLQANTHQSPMLSGGSLRIQDANQGLPETRTPSLGYHALPPMVSLPTTQTNKHQPVAASQRVLSSNPLPTLLPKNGPINGNLNETNQYLCSICRSFQTPSLEAIKDHMTKHFSFRGQQTPTVIVSVPSVDPITLSAPFVETGRNGKQDYLKNITVDMNPVTNPTCLRDWTIKDTPQGPVLVTPFQTEVNTNRTVLRQASVNSNNLLPNPLYNSLLVFRCRICKAAMYKSYPPLRNHAILVHGITDFNSLDQANISQNGYLCTQCPNTSALFDSEEQFREHVDTIHTHSCPSCQRVFSNFLTLRHHLEQCRVSTSSNRNTYGKNC